MKTTFALATLVLAATSVMAVPTGGGHGGGGSYPPSPGHGGGHPGGPGGSYPPGNGGGNPPGNGGGNPPGNGGGNPPGNGGGNPPGNGGGNPPGNGGGNGGGGSYDPCSGLYDSPQCCATDVLGVADLDCAGPGKTLTSAADFKATCATVGQRARCCILPILGQGILCQTPAGL